MQKQKIKLLFLDVELAPNLATVWGIFNQNIGINQLLNTSRVMCYAAKWYGEKKVIFDSEDQSDHSAMIEGLHEILSEADIVCHYNGNRFDMPVINREFLLKGMPPPDPYKNLDLLRVVKHNFRFTSNKLDHIANELGLGGKVAHTGHQLWLDCMDGDSKAWKLMEKYNRQDVILLDKLYDKLLPWMYNHPNVGLYIDPDKPTCTNCGSTKIHSRGVTHSKTQTYRRFQCQNCHTWLRGRTTIVPKSVKPNILTQERIV